MYDQSREVEVYKASLPYMAAAKDLASSLQMNDHGPLHAQRVHSIAKRLGSLFPLTLHELSLLLAAALLHDIGMAKNREDHHEVSFELVKEMAECGKLPFDESEAEIVATLCKWHRKEYDSNAIAADGTRTGLLASLLRLADGMDLDYRRSDDFNQKEEVIDRFNVKQKPHHLSVINILALRFYVSRMEKRIEIFLDQFDHASLQLGRLIDEMVHTPISWPIQIIPVHKNIFENIQKKEEVKQKAIVFSYCNPHGAISAAISKRQLDFLGFETKVVYNYEHTGYAPKFWDKYFLDWNFDDIELVVILGMHISENQFKSVLNKISCNSHCLWTYASPLDMINKEIKQLTITGVNVLLGDERALFLGNSIDEESFFWMRVAGLCNFDDQNLFSFNMSREEYDVSRGLRYSLWSLINEKKSEESCHEIINKIIHNERKFFIENEPLWMDFINSNMPKFTKYGRVLMIGNVDIPGRFIYDIATKAIESQGLLPYENNEFSTPYVIYRRNSQNGIVILFYSHFSITTKAFPIKYFVSQCSEQLGSSSSIWQTYSDKETAKIAVNETIKRINSHFNESCQKEVEDI